MHSEIGDGRWEGVMGVSQDDDHLILRVSNKPPLGSITIWSLKLIEWTEKHSSLT